MVLFQPDLPAALQKAFPAYQGFDPEDYLHAEGIASQALLCVDLFFPGLEELEGSIFLRQAVADPRQRDRALLQLASGQPAEEVERSFNRQELPFAFNLFALPGVSEWTLASAIARSWELWLPSQLPGRQFKTDLVAPGSGSVTTVRFWEGR